MSKGRRVAEGIGWVGCGSWGGRTEVLSVEGSGNVYLVGAGGDWALIDAGTPDGVPAVLENARALGAWPERIARIVLTHSHGDHAGGAGALQEATGARVCCSELTAAALRGDESARKRLCFHADLRLQADEILRDGDEIRLGPWRLGVMLTPGHIPDALTLLGEVAGRRVAFTGDTAIGDQGGARGVVGWLDGHWHSNPKHLLASIRRIASFRAHLLLPGHGLPIEGEEAVAASLHHCVERLERLLAIPDLGSMMPLDLSD